jgi:hypothetical protein
VGTDRRTSLPLRLGPQNRKPRTEILREVSQWPQSLMKKDRKPGEETVSQLSPPLIVK